MADAWLDVRYSARVLRKSSAVTVFAILSLALAIGANTAAFTVCNALLLRPLLVRDPQQLVTISTIRPDDSQQQPLSVASFEQIARNRHLFAAMFAWRGDYSMAHFEANGARYASALAEVSGDYFTTLGIQPLLGRVLTANDTGAALSVAVLDYRCWRDRYHSDPDIIGKSVRVQGRPLTIVGVTPKEATGVVVEVAPEAVVPLGLFPPAGQEERTARRVGVMARLRPGITLERARAELQAQWLTTQESTSRPNRIHVQPAAMGISYMREGQSRPLAVLMGIVAFVLLIACANLANLMLARSTARRREIEIRTALGAGRWRLVRQLLIESLMLSMAGAAAGLFFAWWSAPQLVRFTWTGYVPNAMNVTPDLRVLAFTAGAALFTSLLFGMAPARHTLRIALPGASAVGNGGSRLLLSVQVALSLVLVTGAILLVRTVENMRSAELGFGGRRNILVHLFPQPARERIADRAAYYRQLAINLEQLPGVESVSYSRFGPFTNSRVRQPVTAASAALDCTVEYVGPGFFKWIGMSLLAGREFAWTDREGASPVVIVTDALARRLFGPESAVGKRITVGQTNAHIVGVVNSASLWNVRDRQPSAVFLPLIQEPSAGQPMAGIRLAGGSAPAVESIRIVVESLGYQYALRIETIEERARNALAEERMMSLLGAFFSGLSLLLAALGIYGLTSYSIGRRTAEIGVRMSVGAQPRDIVSMVVRDASALLTAGILAGIPVALGASRVMSGMLYGVSPRDPAVIALAAVIIAGVSMSAALVPARRAARMQPMTALRHD
jgi:putative ABC transport system permease protein